MTLDTLIFKGAEPGPVMLALGAIHGNETCGTIGIGRLVMEIRSGLVTIDKGTLILAPICNPKAYAAGLRFVEFNLNRIITPHAAPESCEHRFANEVIALIDSADILLDLHSYTAGTKPFLFLDIDNPRSREYAMATGIEDWVTGWAAAYKDKPELSSGDTTAYANLKGKHALLIECGQHEDPRAALVAYQSLRTVLAHFGLTKDTGQKPVSKPNIHVMQEVIVKDKPGAFVQNWQHLDPVAKDQVIIRYEDGSTRTSPFDGVILLPKLDPPIGHEWLYIGVAAE